MPSLVTKGNIEQCLSIVEWPEPLVDLNLWSGSSHWLSELPTHWIAMRLLSCDDGHTLLGSTLGDKRLRRAWCFRAIVWRCAWDRSIAPCGFTLAFDRVCSQSRHRQGEV